LFIVYLYFYVKLYFVMCYSAVQVWNADPPATSGGL